MSHLKKFISVLWFLSLIVLTIALYWNSHLLYKASTAENNEEKIEILENANKYFPFNSLVFYELGKAFHDLGMRSLNDSQLSASLFQHAISNYQQSLILNPASQFCHFNLARSLYYLDIKSTSLGLSPEEELKKAALLVDNNSEIYFEVGMIFLGQWHELTEADTAFAIDISKKILETRKGKKILSLLHAWEINVNDYELLKSILPVDVFVYKTVANYLGERSLDLEERHKLLSEGEFLEFEAAQSDHQKGEREFYHFNLSEASRHFESCLTRLKRIRFYQELIQQNLIKPKDYDQLENSTYLNLAKCKIEENRSLEEAQIYLEEYLSREENARAVNELESYLVERRIIDKNLGTSFERLDQLYLLLFLAYKQNRYAEIIRIGRFIQTNYLIITEDLRAHFVKILQIVGDAFHRADNLYNATDYYKRAFDLDSENLNTLLKMMRNYERLNDTAGMRQTSQEIEKVLFPHNMNIRMSLIKKRHRSSRRMVLDGRKILLSLYFENNMEGVLPLVSIHFNRHVVWEDYLKDNVLSLQLDSKIGENVLQVVAVNKELSFKRMTYKFLE